MCAGKQSRSLEASCSRSGFRFLSLPAFCCCHTLVPICVQGVTNPLESIPTLIATLTDRDQENRDIAIGVMTTMVLKRCVTRKGLFTPLHCCPLSLPGTKEEVLWLGGATSAGGVHPCLRKDHLFCVHPLMMPVFASLQVADRVQVSARRLSLV